MKLKITTHSGDEEIVEVDSYNAQEITEMRNSDDEAIALGKISFSRIDIKNIKPVE